TNCSYLLHLVILSIHKENKSKREYGEILMIDKRLFRLPGTKKLLLMLAGLTLLQAFVVLFQGKYLAEALVNSWEQKPLQTIIDPMLLFAASFVLRHLFNLINTKIVEKFASKTSEDIRRRL